MNAEIITIGDEILIGQIVDTNSAWLGEQLNAIGVSVTQITSISDRVEAIKAAFDDAFDRADIVIVTGGLGPTKDDITKHTLAEYFSSKLVLHEPTLQMLQKMFADRGAKFQELNRCQAFVPECCEVIPNYNGTAPGMWFERQGKVLISMPGVPFEMKPIFTNEIVERIKSHFSLRSVVHKTLLVFGLAESLLADTISEWENDLPKQYKLAYLPNPNGIRLRLSAYDVDKDESMTEIERRFDLLENIIPENILGFEPTSVERVVADILTLRNETVAVAESCTGGMIAGKFTAMSGASAYFSGGIVAYSNDVKVDLLKVKRSDIENHGAVSREVAEAMAIGVRNITGSCYGISTTGVAGPDGATPNKPVGTVWIALATSEGVSSIKKTFGKLREQNIQLASAHAINMLRQYLNSSE